LLGVTSTASGTFDVDLTPGATELDGAVGRFDLRKQFRGDLEGTGAGIMLSGGNPMAGEAGYVAIEVVRGQLAGLTGSFALQQFGTMSGGSQLLTYEVVPGSGTGELTGIAGTFLLTIEDDGTHRYDLTYDLPA
jgi:hypothetical protein